MIDRAMVMFVYATIMAQLCGLVFTFLLFILRRSPKLSVYRSLVLLLTLSLICVIRPLMAIEMPYTTVIPSTVIYPAILDFLKFEVVTTAGVSITVLRLLAGLWILGAIASLAMMLRSQLKCRAWLKSLGKVDNKRIKTALAVRAPNSA